jgi:hypothetical protein
MSYEDLYDNGVCVLSQYLPEEKYISLRKDVSQYLKANVFQKNIKPAGKDVSFNTLRKLGKLFINKRIPQRDGDDGLIDVWNINKGLSKESQDIIKEIAQDIENKLTDTFKTKYSFKTCNLYVNQGITKTRGIHADTGKFPSRAKAFLYFTDISDIHDGPFSFILGSHFKEGKKYHHKYDIYKPLNKEHQEKYKIFDEVKQNYLLVGCVSGAHRGMPQKKGRERIVLVLSFDP